MSRSFCNPILIFARIFALSLAGAAVPSTHATTVDSYLRNREGVTKFNDKSYYPAYQAFLRAMQVDPLNPEIQLNVARIFEANEEYEKAELGYRGVLKLVPEPGARRFEALFNLAGVLAKQSKIDGALAAYQECLDMQPESKEVKTNIELLMQGGGGGGGKDNKDDKDKDKDKGKDQKPKDGEGKPDPKQPQDQKDAKEPKKQPRPFDSKDLSPQDVKKILDEIKNQEQSIRAQEYERNSKERGNSKDW